MANAKSIFNEAMTAQAKKVLKAVKEHYTGFGEAYELKSLARLEKAIKTGDADFLDAAVNEMTCIDSELEVECAEFVRFVEEQFNNLEAI